MPIHVVRVGLLQERLTIGFKGVRDHLRATIGKQEFLYPSGDLRKGRILRLEILVNDISRDRPELGYGYDHSSQGRWVMGTLVVRVVCELGLFVSPFDSLYHSCRVGLPDVELT